MNMDRLHSVFRKSFNSFLLPVRMMQIKRLELYQNCYRILGVEENSDQNTVRKAYIEIVKKVHPDSGHEEASAERFQQVDEAFKTLQEKFAKNRRGINDDEEEEEVFDIKHTAPQHRQYLSYEGYGFGTPFQRQKQYQQVKAMKAQERVLSHRLEKAHAGEKTIMKKGSFFKNHAIKTKYGFDRVVEDLIQEAMNKGDFNNLTGSGKPLSNAQSQNPYLDFTTHKLNRILLDNGFTPEWIMLQKDIRDSVDFLKNSLIKDRSYFGDYPFAKDQEQIRWELTVSQYSSNVEQINRDIDKYNLIVPILQNQLFRISLEKIADKILKDETLPRNLKRLDEQKTHESNSPKSDLFSFIGSLF
ncbi:dnaJ homolog subfamily C member 28 [Eupeodes corollae]|uniref:dnaJ homolog subfamily C member 28 n=1 Tax=Eupeodes corollae TaxID=290404 RepID=UPI00249084F8|nr:dnaJ homolog subfamily C member 28 [Eupeodes corollae]XP_055911557.1 dnaJ homolog subfamily C member 28 [Eupeodes corollae]XP_055911558.1 dnaJ homolog subfamily C member 28 [Eupeodes corollae]